MGVEDRRIVFRQAFCDPFFEKEGLDPGLFEGVIELAPLVADDDIFIVEDVRKTDALVEDVGRSRNDAGVDDGP